jgi:hypothetical protein
MLLLFDSLARRMYTGVFLLSRDLASSNLGFQYFILDRTLLCSIAAEKGGPDPKCLSSPIKLLVKEWSPTPGAQVSNPQAAMTSVIPLPLPAAELAAAQQSRRIKTSELASSSIVWRPNHFTVAPSGRPVLHITC